MTVKNVRVGTGLIVVKNRKVLVGKRRGSHASGVYSFPGGHLDWNETWDQCVLRELQEECGDKIRADVRGIDEFIIGAAKQVYPLFVTNDIMPEWDKHYVTIFIVADWVSGEAINAEPDKCDGWEWVITSWTKCAKTMNVPNGFPCIILRQIVT